MKVLHYYLRALSYNIKEYKRWARSRREKWVYLGLRPISKNIINLRYYSF